MTDVASESPYHGTYLHVLLAQTLSAPHPPTTATTEELDITITALLSLQLFHQVRRIYRFPHNAIGSSGGATPVRSNDC